MNLSKLIYKNFCLGFSGKINILDKNNSTLGTIYQTKDTLAGANFLGVNGLRALEQIAINDYYNFLNNYLVEPENICLEKKLFYIKDYFYWYKKLILEIKKKQSLKPPMNTKFKLKDSVCLDHHFFMLFESSIITYLKNSSCWVLASELYSLNDSESIITTSLIGLKEKGLIETDLRI